MSERDLPGDGPSDYFETSFDSDDVDESAFEPNKVETLVEPGSLQKGTKLTLKIRGRSTMDSTVRWGGAEGGSAKAEALRAALRKAARGASEVDVSSPGVVLTR